jgi:Na+/H+-dicarboxylate symporter
MQNSASSAWYRQLHWQILIAMILGTAAGLLGGPGLADQIGWIGTLFIKLLKMVIVPLVVASIITGVASVGGGRSLGRLFSKTLGYYVLTSLLAALVGLMMVNLIRPGVGAELVDLQSQQLPQLSTATSPSDLVLSFVPENIVAAAAQADMIALILFCILFALAVASIPAAPRETILGFFNAVFEAMMKLTRWIIAVAPIGVFALIVRVVGDVIRKVEPSAGTSSSLGLLEMLKALALYFKPFALYMVTITSGLAIHLFLVLPLLLILLGRIRPSIHFRNMLEPLTLAFSSSTSMGTLPVTITAVEKRVGVSNKISSFVLPMGATVNMDGTALYECAGVIFISQVLGYHLSLTQQLVVVVTALLASIGAAAVPSAGLVIIFLVLEAVGLRGPAVDALVGVMLAVDRPLDMMRTSVNVFSDSCGAAIIARSEGETDVDSEVRSAA